MNKFYSPIGSKQEYFSICLHIGIQKKRGTLPLLILLLEVLENLSYKNKQATPTPNMKCHQTEPSTKGRSAGGIYISQRAFTALLLWIGEKVSSFLTAKTSAKDTPLLKIVGTP